MFGNKMMEVIITACLEVSGDGSADRCKDFNLHFEAEAMTPYHCMARGQIEIAKWKEEHPKWTVMRWQCRPGRPAVDA